MCGSGSGRSGCERFHIAVRQGGEDIAGDQGPFPQELPVEDGSLDDAVAAIQRERNREAGVAGRERAGDESLIDP